MRWTVREENRLRTMLARKMTRKAIADALKRSPDAVDKKIDAICAPPAIHYRPDHLMDHGEMAMVYGERSYSDVRLKG